MGGISGEYCPTEEKAEGLKGLGVVVHACLKFVHSALGRLEADGAGI